MRSEVKIPFVKYHGAGNDFIMVDDRGGVFGPALTTSWIAQACHRHFGVGADGMILLEEGREGADFFMKYYNSDGRTSSFCGNGGRCIAAFAKALGIHGGTCKFLGTDGWHAAEEGPDGLIRLSMSDVNHIEKLNETNYVLNTGSPHLVRFTEHIDVLDITAKGREIRTSAPFKKEGINVNFVEVLAPGEIKVRTYERGVEDETFACGTGVVASALATAYASDQAPASFVVHARGGDLQVEFERTGKQSFSKVRLIGPAVESFRGELIFPASSS